MYIYMYALYCKDPKFPVGCGTGAGAPSPFRFLLQEAPLEPGAPAQGHRVRNPGNSAMFDPWPRGLKDYIYLPLEGFRVHFLDMVVEMVVYTSLDGGFQQTPPHQIVQN